MFGVKQIHRDRYARCLQSILINCVTAEKKNTVLTTVATKSFVIGNCPSPQASEPELVDDHFFRLFLFDFNGIVGG